MASSPFCVCTPAVLRQREHLASATKDESFTGDGMLLSEEVELEEEDESLSHPSLCCKGTGSGLAICSWVSIEKVERVETAVVPVAVVLELAGLLLVIVALS